MPFAIYPPIGIARVGNDVNKFFVGPEIPGHPGVEVDAQGVETPLIKYKVDEDQIKRQAARFRLFDLNNGEPQPAVLPAGARVEWTVHLVNKKAAVVRASTPPALPAMPQLAPNSATRIIDSGSRTIAGANSSGAIFDQGEFLGRRVPLGELRTDRAQNLMVLGGFGFSSSPTSAPLPSFYTNPGWHDDVSDGPVTARIILQDGTAVTDIKPAWVVVGPPDFAPDIQAVVSLFDIMQQVGKEHFGVQLPAPISFTKHVFPILHRTRRLRWVNEDPNWSDVSDDFPALANASPAAAQLRSEQVQIIKNIEAVLTRFSLTSFQESILNQWASGNFVSDFVGVPQPGNAITAAGMTRAALESTAGQGFFPGIEGGILLTRPSIYSQPFDFRFDHNQMQPGDLTALMAVPWQADFFDCSRSWWPSQRPDDVRANANANNTIRWERGVNSHAGMVNNFSRLAFITAQKDAQGNIVFAEDQRAPGTQFL